MKRTKTQKLIHRKARKVLSAQQQLWAKKGRILQTFQENAKIAGIPAIEYGGLSVRVFGFRDACILVRFKGIADKRFDVFDIDAPLSNWRDHVRIPLLANGKVTEVLHGRACGLGTWIDCMMNGYHIPYLESLICKYGEEPELEDSIHDLSITIAGALAHVRTAGAQPPDAQDVIGSLESLHAQFIELLDQTAEDNSKEEILQVFLKENPLLMIPNGQAIPKQKLGEDFCTDFVLIDMLDQGRQYTLVEIEKSSHHVFTKNGELRSQVQHAVHQTCQWDVWLQTHSAYIREKLPGFESPQYMIVIGRSTEFTDENRTYLRAYNRKLNDTTLLTYDDLAKRFEDRVSAMKKQRDTSDTVASE